MAKSAKKAHPLDIPGFLVAKGRGPRDEAVCRAMAKKAAARTSGMQEQGDPRILDAIRKGVIAASVLKDPKSQAIFLANMEKKTTDRGETREAKKAEKEAVKAAKPKFLDTADIAKMLSEGRAERVRKGTIRKALDDTNYPKRDGKRNYLPEEFDAIKKIVLEWQPKPKKAKSAAQISANYHDDKLQAAAKERAARVAAHQKRVEEKAPVDPNAKKVARAKGAAAMEIARLDAKIKAKKVVAKKGNKK